MTAMVPTTTRRKTPTPIQKVHTRPAASNMGSILGVVPSGSESPPGPREPMATEVGGVGRLERVGPRGPHAVADGPGLLAEHPDDLVVRGGELLDVTAAGGQGLEHGPLPGG